jgi:ATP phosphoribosyltransferase
LLPEIALTSEFLTRVEARFGARPAEWHSGATMTERRRIWRMVGQGHADLVIAVPKAWVDVETTEDLDAVAAQFRSNHNMRLRIATKYHRLVRDFLRERGVADYALVDSQGATEGTVANETADLVADITTSGETLRANHLKVLTDGVILPSEATLWRSRTADGYDRAVMTAFLERLELV